MPLVLAEHAPRFHLHSAEFVGLAAPSRGATETAVWRVTIAGLSRGVSHRLNREEILLALKGNAQVSLAGEEFEFPAGAALIVPADTEFSLSNPHEAAFEAIAVLPVGGMAQIGQETPFTPPWAL